MYSLCFVRFVCLNAGFVISVHPFFLTFFLSVFLSFIPLTCLTNGVSAVDFPFAIEFTGALSRARVDEIVASPTSVGHHVTIHIHHFTSSAVGVGNARGTAAGV